MASVKGVAVDVNGTYVKNPVMLKLEAVGLGQYASAVMHDQGYDTMESFQEMTREEAESIADDVKMKPGHKRQFVNTFAK